MKSNPSDNLMEMKAKKRLKSTNEINHVDKFEKKKKVLSKWNVQGRNSDFALTFQECILSDWQFKESSLVWVAPSLTV